MDKLYASARTKLAQFIPLEQDVLDELVYMYVYSETAASVTFKSCKKQDKNLTTS